MPVGVIVALVVLAILDRTFSLSAAEAPFEEYGVVSPPDPFLFVGETLNLSCTLANAHVSRNSSSLYFQIKTLQGRRILKAEEVVDARSISLSVPGVGVRDEGTYSCWQRGNIPGEKPRIIGHQLVRIDEKPRQVENESCRVYNWEELKCTWDLAVAFHHPDLVNVSVNSAAAGIMNTCPILTKTSCRWDKSTYQHRHHLYVEVIVAYIVKDKVLSQSSKVFIVETQLYETSAYEETNANINVTVPALVEPGPVEKLTVWMETETCARLAWRYLSGVDKAKMFVAQWKSSEAPTAWQRTIVDETSSNRSDSFSLKICDLQLYTLYHFWVAVKPFSTNTSDAFRLGHTSEWREVTTWTTESVPSAGPEICPVCFYDTETVNSRRKISVIWKEIPALSRNGKLIYYNISFLGLKSRHQGFVIRNLTKVPMTSAELTFPSKEAFLIKITGATAVGEASVASFIRIPRLIEGPHPIQQFVVEQDRSEGRSTKLYLSWTPLTYKKDSRHHQESKTLSSVFIVWCRKNSSHCQDGVKWVKLPPDKANFELDSAMTGVHTDHLLIGIAAQRTSEDKLSRGGILWRHCFYVRNQKPKRVPKNIRAFLSKSANGLTVVWERNGCTEERSLITSYVILYCPSLGDGRCTDKLLELNVSSDSSEITLPDLVKGRKYRVSVAAQSSAGRGAARHATFLFEGTETSDKDFWTWLLLSIGVLVLVFLISACFMVAKHCQRGKKTSSKILQLFGTPPLLSRAIPSHDLGDTLPKPQSKTSGGALPCQQGVVDMGQDQTASDESGEDNASSQTPLISKPHLDTDKEGKDPGKTKCLADERSGTLSGAAATCEAKSPEQHQQQSSTAGSVASYHILSGADPDRKTIDLTPSPQLKDYVMASNATVFKQTEKTDTSPCHQTLPNAIVFLAIEERGNVAAKLSSNTICTPKISSIDTQLKEHLAQNAAQDYLPQDTRILNNPANLTKVLHLESPTDLDR